MKRLFLMLALLLVMTGCKHGDNMLQCPEGYRSEYDIPPGDLQATLHGDNDHSGDYRGVAGHVVIERHEFKAIIMLNDLQLVRQGNVPDTIGIDDGYLSFDLSFF